MASFSYYVTQATVIDSAETPTGAQAFLGNAAYLEASDAVFVAQTVLSLMLIHSVFSIFLAATGKITRPVIKKPLRQVPPATAPFSTLGQDSTGSLAPLQLPADIPDLDDALH
eukprot:gnl/Ergobibamus_cyprinoides/1801.p2 GENE.gnl/Ergobibamus_cyprinoides/1801~~gnl/Ergobibamus_cyprinoides/1801.p2  ORF type:complete len:113 (+),score=23.07 gnl/Ergobibamus_cyprinoides/1801:3-341(+)